MAKVQKLVMLLLGILIVVVVSENAMAIYSISRTPSSLTLGVGDTGTYTVTVTPDLTTTTGTFSVDILPAESNFGVVIRDSSGILASGNGGDTVQATVSYSNGTSKTFYVDITNNGATGTYTVKFTANDGSELWTEANIYAGLTAVPEFATIAIPATLAILGGLFFLRRL